MHSVEIDDQASGLRRLFGEASLSRTCALFGPDAGLKAVAAANLAFALARRGERVLVLDEAEAPRNVASQFGLSPRWRLEDVVQGRCDLDQAMLNGPEGIQLLAADHGLPVLAAISETTWARVLQRVLDLDLPPTWTLINAPAGQSAPALACACPDRILVVPDRKNVITDAYAVLKAVHQLYPDGSWRVLAMNQTSSRPENGVFPALLTTAQRFLGIPLGWAGGVPKDDKLGHAMRVMKPVLEVSPNSPAALAFKTLADLASAWPVTGGMDARTFWQRLYLLSQLAVEMAGKGAPNAGFGRKCA